MVYLIDRRHKKFFCLSIKGKIVGEKILSILGLNVFNLFGIITMTGFAAALFIGNKYKEDKGSKAGIVISSVCLGILIISLLITFIYIDYFKII